MAQCRSILGVRGAAGQTAERIEELLTEQEEMILSQLDIVDRALKAWKEFSAQAQDSLATLERLTDERENAQAIAAE